MEEAFPAFATLLVLFHLTAVRCHLHAGFAKLWAAMARFMWGTGSSAQRDPMARRVDEELHSARQDAYRYLAGFMVHPTVFALGTTVQKICQGSTKYLWNVVVITLSYALDMGASTGRLTMTPSRLKAVSFFYFSFPTLVGFSKMCAEPADFAAERSLLVASQILVGVGFMDSSFAVTWGFIFSFMDYLSFRSVHGAEKITEHVMVYMGTQLFLLCLIPIVAQVVVRARCRSALEKQDTKSMMMGFRQIVKGMCDGVLLLDDEYKICFDGSCLQRLLGTSEDLTMLSFTSILEDATTVENFEKFVTTSTREVSESVYREQQNAPSCMRISLVSPSGRKVAADLLHVPLPHLFGGERPHHLLAFSEDPEAQEQPDARPEDIPPGLRLHRQGSEDAEPSRAGAADVRSVRSVPSSEGDLIQAYEELEELTLLLSTSTSLVDVEEAHFRFERRSSNPKLQGGMPTLRRFARPLDWPYLQASVDAYAELLAKKQAPASQALQPLFLRLPGESRKYLVARQALLSPVFPEQQDEQRPEQAKLPQAPAPSGSPEFMYLHLTQFRKNTGGEEGRAPLYTVSEHTDLLPT